MIVTLTMMTTDPTVAERLTAEYPTAVVRTYTNKAVTHPQQRPIKCVETGIVYNNAGEAGRAMGIDRGNIHKQVNGKIKSAGGYRFEYV